MPLAVTRITRLSADEIGCLQGKQGFLSVDGIKRRECATEVRCGLFGLNTHGRALRLAVCRTDGAVCARSAAWPGLHRAPALPDLCCGYRTPARSYALDTRHHLPAAGSCWRSAVVHPSRHCYAQ